MFIGNLNKDLPNCPLQTAWVCKVCWTPEEHNTKTLIVVLTLPHKEETSTVISQWLV
jgi:hypothetical protein